MGGQMALSVIEASLFDGTNYSSWGESMKQYFNSKGSEVWNSVVSKPWDLAIDEFEHTLIKKSSTYKTKNRSESFVLRM
jgi:hypothetical protein